MPWETYITVTCGLQVFSDMCVGKHASLVICVRGEYLDRALFICSCILFYNSLNFDAILFSFR